MRHVPATVQEYREPFVGGGSVFLAMKSLFGRRIRRYCINDLNHDLYCFWKYARDKNSELTDAARTFKDTYADGRELWRFLKAEGNMSSEFERAVRFFILNRITFSGVVDSGGYSQSAFERRFTQSSIDRLAQRPCCKVWKSVMVIMSRGCMPPGTMFLSFSIRRTGVRRILGCMGLAANFIRHLTMSGLPSRCADARING